MVNQPFKSTTASSTKGVYGVTKEEAELQYTNRPAQTRAVSPPRHQECYKKCQYAWQTVRSKKRSIKWNQAPTNQQYSKLASKPLDKHEKDSSKSNGQEQDVKKAKKMPNPSQSPKPAQTRKRRLQCQINCAEKNNHI